MERKKKTNEELEKEHNKVKITSNNNKNKRKRSNAFFYPKPQHFSYENITAKPLKLYIASKKDNAKKKEVKKMKINT